MDPNTQKIRRARRAEAALLVIAVIATVAALKLAQDFFVPVILGIFGAYALRPIVNKLADWHIPETLAAGLVMVALVACIVGGGYGMRDQAASAMADLPQAAHSIRMRVRTLLSESRQSPIANVKEAAAELKKAASEVSGEPAPPAVPSAGIVDRLAADGVDALGGLTTLGIALAVMMFVLAAGNSFRRKLLHVAGNTLRERRITVEILDEIDGQIQRYLLVMLSTNVALGVALWGVFLAFGVERAAFWASCVAVLHAIPYVGIVLALGLMAGVSILQFANAGVVFGVLACTALASTAIGLFLQNWLQGRASQMNPVAVFIAVLFFGWLWGGWGLLLGAPLIAIVRTIANRIDSLAPLCEFLSADADRRRPV
ncbi:MAG: AI-2E family transporter, partial [Casimicrobiaceae bacterium]